MLSAQRLTAEFRSEMRDEASPYLWSDSDVVRYINESVRQLCVRSWGILDSSVRVTLPGTGIVPIPSYILKIKKAWVTSTGRDVELVAIDEMPNLLLGRPKAVKPDYLVTGIEENKLLPVPDVLEPLEIGLICWRLPLVWTTSATDQTPTEIPDDAIEGILHHMRGMAFLKSDSETFDKGKSNAHFDDFDVFVKQWKHIRDRREHNPRSTNRKGDYW